MTRPIGSSSPKNRSAVAWLTTVIAGPFGPSASVKMRPRRTGTPIVRKKSGLTMRQSIGTGVSGGSGDFPIVVNGVVV